MALPPQVPPVGAPSPGSSTFNMWNRCAVLVVPVARAASGLPIVSCSYGTTVFAAGAAFERTHRFHETTAGRPDWPRRTP